MTGEHEGDGLPSVERDEDGRDLGRGEVAPATS